MVLVRFLGNACVELIGEKDHLIIDPAYIEPPQQGIKKVFITHEHSDHIDVEKTREICEKYCLDDETPEFYGPISVWRDVSSDITVVEPSDVVSLFNGKVSTYQNECWKSEVCVAYLIELDRKVILHSADSAKFSDSLRDLRIDIDCCFVACFESNFEDYLKFIKILKPQLTLPYHFTAEKVENAKKLVAFLNDNDLESNFVAIGKGIEL